MDFIRNFPFFSIILCMFGGIVSACLGGRAARWVNTAVISVVLFFSVATTWYCIQTGGSFVYQMGHFSAPWGNEIRAGILEGLIAVFFCIIMLLSLIGGRSHLVKEIEKTKINYYYVLVDLLLSSLLALIYTNDIFTAYVFVEINTLAACGLIMIRQTGRTIEASVRYMIMSLLGSGLLLLGIAMLYDLTGHLLMSNIKEQVQILAATGEYEVPLLVTIGLICVGLAIKSALYPFHSWLADAYGYSTVSSSAILSSLVSKGYIFLLIKLVYRVFGFEVFRQSNIINVLFVFGLAGMIFGSWSAMKENDIRRMISFSSVAQIGYIFMGIGLGTEAGMIAAVFHIISHGITKSLLFISASGLSDVSGGSRKFQDLTGSAYRNKIAGVAFTVGCFSMIGIPLFSGFVSKLLFCEAAVVNQGKMMPALVVLAISTILNAVYFMKTVLRIYSPKATPSLAVMSEEVARKYNGEGETVQREYPSLSMKNQAAFSGACITFCVLNLWLGTMSEPIVELIERGLEMFA